MAKLKLKTENFIKKAQEIHGDKFDYSLVNYINSRTKVKIICPEHGAFEQLPYSHLKYKNACKFCSYEIVANKRRLTTKDFIERSKYIHRNKYNIEYDYSLVEYIDNATNVKIICPIHGEFLQIPDIHMNGAGCPRCKKNFKLTLEQFIQKANLKHNFKYKYSKVEYINSSSKVCIICSEHGEFWQEANAHLQGAGCPKCKESLGEKNIREFLIKNNINYISQKRFNNLFYKNKKCKLSFDFYLPDYNLCIEFDGVQHFKPHSFSSDQSEEVKNKNLKTVQERDQIKTEYCKNNNIKLLRISYLNFSVIEKILTKNIL